MLIIQLIEAQSNSVLQAYNQYFSWLLPPPPPPPKKKKELRNQIQVQRGVTSRILVRTRQLHGLVDTLLPCIKILPAPPRRYNEHLLFPKLLNVCRLQGLFKFITRHTHTQKEKKIIRSWFNLAIDIRWMLVYNTSYM